MLGAGPALPTYSGRGMCAGTRRTGVGVPGTSSARVGMAVGPCVERGRRDRFGGASLTRWATRWATSRGKPAPRRAAARPARRWRRSRTTAAAGRGTRAAPASPIADGARQHDEPGAQARRAGAHERGGPRGERGPTAERGGRGQQPEHVGRLVVARPAHGREDDHRDDVRGERERRDPAAGHAEQVVGLHPRPRGTGPPPARQGPTCRRRRSARRTPGRRGSRRTSRGRVRRRCTRRCRSCRRPRRGGRAASPCRR